MSFYSITIFKIDACFYLVSFNAIIDETPVHGYEEGSDPIELMYFACASITRRLK
jgi:hypothetical protein